MSFRITNGKKREDSNLQTEKELKGDEKREKKNQ